MLLSKLISNLVVYVVAFW